MRTPIWPGKRNRAFVQYRGGSALEAGSTHMAVRPFPVRLNVINDARAVSSSTSRSIHHVPTMAARAGAKGLVVLHLHQFEAVARAL